MAPVTFTLNGRSVSVEPESAGTTLLDAVRAQGLTGAREGCAEGECGACTVVMVSSVRGRTALRAVNSCLMLLPLAAGHEVYTVESLAGTGTLSPAQRAMADAGGSQCGYCTPGFVMSLVAEQYRPDRAGACDTMALAGNLCRCTGYRPIRDAAQALGSPPPGALRDRLAGDPPSLLPLSTASFSRPTSVDECVAVLAAHPDARLVAGATDLAVESNLHGRRVPHLVSIEAVGELRALAHGQNGVRIGAGLTLAEIGELWTGAPPAVADWLTLFASPPVRNRATLGGNLATASPIGDAAPLLMALDARVEIAGPASTDPRAPRVARRTVGLNHFFTGYRRSMLERADVLTAVEVPHPFPQALRFYKVSKRRLDDISTVAAAMAVDRDAAGRVTRARFCFGGVAATPVRVTAAEDAVVGRFWEASSVARVQDVLRRTLTPLSDHRGSKEYRLEVAASLVAKFLAETAHG